MPDCIFCRIATGEIPSQVVYNDERVVAFRDINPQAPTHIVLIPRSHVASLDYLAEADEGLVGHLIRVGSELARKENVATPGYRLVANCGPDAGQSVAHLHFHLLGGRSMGWPPG